ncbi:MAG: outer membrane lipoprotein-sorting protein [Paracoccaceae bacterium]
MRFFRGLFAGLFVISLLTLGAGGAVAQDARAIMERVDANGRALNNSAFATMQISTCKFGIKGGKVKCAARPTIKKIENASINTGAGGKDVRSIAIILEPASERGIGMLTYTYDNSRKDNETWLYLSALGKVKRLVASNSDANSEPVSLFGSEFTSEDMETGKLDDYTYKLLDTVTYQGRKAYVIEQVPTKARARKTRYARTVAWIDTKRYYMLKAEMFDRRDKEIRRVITGNAQQINGVWLARSTTIMNLITNRLSNLNLSRITFGVQIDAELLTKRALTDKAFRERQLAALRAQAQ